MFIYLSYSYPLLVLYPLVASHSLLDYLAPLIASQVPLQGLRLLDLVLQWVMVPPPLLLLLPCMPPIVLLALHYPLYIISLDPPIHNHYHQIHIHHHIIIRTFHPNKLASSSTPTSQSPKWATSRL